jgi:cobalamin-dependent methionine synthase I
MKKLCNKCGGELDVSKRFCEHCGAFNPFFISSFKQTHVSENIEKRGLEDLAGDEKVFPTEQEKNDLDLKKEIQRIKQESEINAKEIREELKHIGEENRKLRDEIESMSRKSGTEKTKPDSNPEAAATVRKPVRTGRSVVAGISVFVLLAGFIVGYFFLTKSGGQESVDLQNKVKQTDAISKPEAVKAPVIKTEATDTAKAPDVVVFPDTFKQSKLIAMSSPPAKRPSKAIVRTTKRVQPAKSVAKDDFVLSEAKAKRDLVGRKLSGCGISVNKAAEVVSLQNLVMVEELPSGEVKYKCIATIVQGGDTYTVTPYMYYNPDGVLINVDGTDCE